MKEIRLIYYSEATREISLLDIQEILKVARDNNRALDICGMLCYESFWFLQVLEGEESKVKGLFDKIEKDERHQDVVVVSEEEIDSKVFGEWQMGYAGSSCNFLGALKEIGQDEFSPEDMSSEQCLQFLESLTVSQTI